MKKLKYILLGLLAVTLSNCDTNDDGFYNNVTVDIPNLITIEPHSTTYTVGEKLYINADFSKNQNETGFGLLDLYKTTGANEFYFSYTIEKQINATEWQTVVVNNNQLDIQKGNAQNTEAYVYGICEYNTLDESYEYRVGFPLLSAGTYRLTFGYNSNSTNTVELRSLSPEKRLIININSLLSGVDAVGAYHFTVN